ncbi:MAG: cob(I)yrinic acid a,c-diamide adenosyltransferase [Nitrospinae bacterium]|nr:cob(I)yrinic acid a,c-diamide adenosyltransferase [Nitrospinota bacterium]
MNDERHKERMARKKAVIDTHIAQASDERGIVIVLTGPGKGKSSSAFGMAARALGHGMKVGVVQYIKGKTATGEQSFFERFPEVNFHVMGAGFTWETQDREKDLAAARAAWEVSLKLLADPTVDLVILDEMNLALRYKHIELDELLAALAARPASQHVVITGRSAPEGLIDYADTVSEIRSVKHAYEAGIRAQKGVEW